MSFGVVTNTNKASKAAQLVRFYAIAPNYATAHQMRQL